MSKDKTADDADLQAYLASSSDEEGTKITPFYNPLCMTVWGNLAVPNLFGLRLDRPCLKNIYKFIIFLHQYLTDHFEQK